MNISVFCYYHLGLGAFHQHRMKIVNNFYFQQKALAKSWRKPVWRALPSNSIWLNLFLNTFYSKLLIKSLAGFNLFSFHDTIIFEYPLATPSYPVGPALYSALSRPLSAAWVDCTTCNSKQCFPISLWVAWKHRTSTDWIVLLPRETMKATNII